MPQTSILQSQTSSTWSSKLERRNLPQPQCSHLPRQWHVKNRVQTNPGVLSALLSRSLCPEKYITGDLSCARNIRTGELLNQAQKSLPSKTSLRVTADFVGPRCKKAAKKKVSKGNYQTHRVPLLTADSSKTEEIVVSVLESFHEDTEPGFFRQYGDNPYDKVVDPFSETRSGGKVGENGAPSPVESNRRLEAILKQLPDVKRRNVLMLMLLGCAESQVAADMANVAEAREKPMEVPSDVMLFRALGVSAKDIYYPKVFEGVWEVDSVMVDVDIPGGIEKMDVQRLARIRRELDKHENWQVRYVDHKGKIIADRLYNTMSLLSSTNREFRGIWNPDEPSFIRIELTANSAGKAARPINAGFGIEEVVLRRSFDLTEPGAFDTSEYSRETVDNPKVYQGPPTVSAKQISTRYKWDPTQDPPDEIKVIQKIATFDIPDEQDLLSMDLDTVLKMVSATTRPTTIKKYVSMMKRA